MGRSVVAEKQLEDAARDMSGSGATCGLLVGHNTAQRALVAGLCRTPADAAGDDLSASWMAKHARQVTQLLPGGIDVLGIFVIGAADLLKTREAQLRSSMTAIYRALEKLQLHDSSTEEKLVAVIDPRTGKITCRSVDVWSAGAALRPAEWRFQSVAWQRVQTELEVDLTAGVAPDAADASLVRQLRISLQPWLSALARSSCLLDGRLVDSDAALSTDKADKARTFTLDLLTDTTELGGDSQLRQESVAAVIRVSGRIHCVAYLQPRATVAEALAAVCRDARRSLLARCQMHCDTLVEEQPAQGEEAPPVLHEPPRRVLAPLLSSRVHVSDYLFPGDSAADSLQTLDDLFGLQLTAEDVLDCVETPAEERAHSESASEAGALDDLRDLQTSSARVGWPLLAAAAAACALAVSAAVFLLTGADSDQREQQQP